MLTHGLKRLAGDSVGQHRRLRRAPPSAKAKVNPAAPIITWRRETGVQCSVDATVMAQPSRDARSIARTMRG